MNSIIILLTSVFLIFIFLLIIFFIILTIHQLFSMKKNRIFFHPTNQEVLEVHIPFIIDKYNLETNKLNFIEIGAGDCNVISKISDQYTWKSLIALEVELFAFLWGKLRLFITNKNHLITLKRVDCIDYNYEENSLIYCYMGREIMKTMYITHLSQPTLQQTKTSQ